MKSPRLFHHISKHGNVLLPGIVLLQTAGCGEVYCKAEYDDTTQGPQAIDDQRQRA